MTTQAIQPRLLADFAAVPTRRERAGVRSHWQTAQVSMFDVEPDELPVCPVCTGGHVSLDCPHGSALTLGGAS